MHSDVVVLDFVFTAEYEEVITICWNPEIIKFYFMLTEIDQVYYFTTLVIIGSFDLSLNRFEIVFKSFWFCVSSYILYIIVLYCILEPRRIMTIKHRFQNGLTY